MATVRIQIFLSSRFEEFRELRQALRQRIESCPLLPLQAVDLDDGHVSHRPPAEDCVAAVRQSEVMILLIGETYGDPAPDAGGRSHTHLEYEAAVAPGAEVVVLPFFVGPSYRNDRIRYAKDGGLMQLQRAVAASHTYRCLGEPESADEAAEEIFQTILKNLIEVRIRAEARWRAQLGDPDDAPSPEPSEPEAGGDDQTFSLEELLHLESRYAGEGVGDLDGGGGSGEGPARVAAAEQMEIALQVMDLGERFVALRHLRSSVELYPLDPKANYCLAMLLAGTHRRSDQRDALRFAVRAARLAEQRTQPVLAAASLILAARTAGEMGQHEEGVRLAEQAVDHAGWLARAHLELAVRYLAVGREDDATRELTSAFKLYPQILMIAESDPNLRRHPVFRQTKEELRQRMAKALRLVHEQISQLRVVGEPQAPSDAPEPPAPERNLRRLAQQVRTAGALHLRSLQSLAARLSEQNDRLNDDVLRAARELTSATNAFAVRQRELVGYGGAAVAVLVAVTVFPIGVPLFSGLLLLGAAGTGVRAALAFRGKRRAQADAETVRERQTELEAGRAAHERGCQAFAQAVEWFEAHVLTETLASPVRRVRQIRQDALVVVRGEGDGMLFHAGDDARPDVDWALLPPHMHNGHPPPAPPARRGRFLVRVTSPHAVGGTRAATRWGAYFSSTG